MNFKINQIQHVGFPVMDIKVSEAFYQKLGFKNVMASNYGVRGDKGRTVMMGRDNIVIELYQMGLDEMMEVINRRNGHMEHIAFDVNNIDDAFTQMKKASFRIMEPEPVFVPFWKKGCKYFNVVGPDGEILEFNQIL
ncbi:MAG: VOC family protein [Bacteroidota bacterium]|nr:VOC family protein [Bacteroidota bacterium]